jgi:hypothetical protein
MMSLLAPFDGSSRVLEPSGGDGAFVSGLVERGVPGSAIEVWDVDPAAGEQVVSFGATFVCCDSLLDMPPGAGRFSHVVGNPPYLNKSSAYIRENRAALARRWGSVGASECYAMFIALAVEQLCDGGQLLFVVSDTFLTLGSHRKLRKLLLDSTQVDQVTLLPRGVFSDAAVATVVVAARKGCPVAGHEVVFTDLRDCDLGVYDGESVRVAQAELSALPGSLFVPSQVSRQLLEVAERSPKMVELLDGGLGMYTGDNAAFVAVVDDGDGPVVPPRGLSVVARDAVDGVVWRAYHKRGGAVRWFAPAEHAVRWDEQSRACYTVPVSAEVGDEGRAGFVVSGVASGLSARLLTPGAMWESNKAFGLFPRDPDRFPPEFFVAALNSAWYRAVAKALNHTVSFQVRDVKALPMLPFTPAEVVELAGLGRLCVDGVRRGVDVSGFEAAVDVLVASVAARVASGSR